jgi:hypothetical protein
MPRSTPTNEWPAEDAVDESFFLWSVFHSQCPLDISARPIDDKYWCLNSFLTMPTTKRKGSARRVIDPITQEAGDGEASETDERTARYAAREAFISKRATVRAAATARRRKKAAKDEDDDYMDDAGASDEEDVDKSDDDDVVDNDDDDNNDDDDDADDGGVEAGVTDPFEGGSGGDDDDDSTKIAEEAEPEDNDGDDESVAASEEEESADDADAGGETISWRS